MAVDDRNSLHLIGTGAGGGEGVHRTSVIGRNAGVDDPLHGVLVEVIAGGGAVGHVAEAGGAVHVFHPAGGGGGRGLLTSGEIDQGFAAGSPGGEGGGAGGRVRGPARQGRTATRRNVSELGCVA